jgi:hypothetical protein
MLSADHFGGLVVAVSKWCTGTEFVEHTVRSLSSKALVPLANRMPASGESAEMAVWHQTVGSQHHNPGRQCQTLKGLCRRVQI